MYRARRVQLERKVLLDPQERRDRQVLRVPKGQLGLLVRQAQPDLAVQLALRVLKAERELPDPLVRLMPTNRSISCCLALMLVPTSLVHWALMAVMALARTLKLMLTVLLVLSTGKLLL